MDWKTEIVRLIRIKQAISEADAEGLWEHHLPRVAATEDELGAAEKGLGFRLDPGYRQFLEFADGWPSFFQSVDLYGTTDLSGGPRLEVAHQLIEAIEPEVFEEAGLKRGEVLPVAATMVDLDVFVMPVRDGHQVPPVVWFAGYEIDRFSSFEDFVLAMIEYNARELSALRRSSSA